MFRVVTVGREYGSGGAPIAEKLACRLGWELVDNSLITEIARAANVDPKLCHRYDERVDSWLHRLNKRTFGLGAFEGVAGGDVFDSDSMAALSRRVIERAGDLGNTVIVGRAGQCVLQGRPDTFHVFIYAPLEERIRRVRQQFGSAFATPAHIAEQDRLRSTYVRHYYQCDWRDPHLYDALFCSLLGDDAIVGMILRAIQTEKGELQNAG
jgi:cytidylate kinase